MDAKAFASRLRTLRERSGLSQKQLAEACNLSQNAISLWEQGKREPTWSAVISVANVLGVTLDDLAEPDDDDLPPSSRGPGRPPLPPAPDLPKRPRGRPKRE